MRSIIRGLIVVGALGLATLSLEAQGGPPGGRPLRPAAAGARIRPGMAIRARAIQRRAAARGVQLTPRQIRNRMIAMRAAERRHVKNMTPEQRQSLKAGRAALRVERQGVAAQLRNGTLTREQARVQMQAWRKDHRPNAALRPPKPPGGDDSGK